MKRPPLEFPLFSRVLQRTFHVEIVSLTMFICCGNVECRKIFRVIVETSD
jgi:hypothetical protein